MFAATPSDDHVTLPESSTTVATKNTLRKNPDPTLHDMELSLAHVVLSHAVPPIRIEKERLGVTPQSLFWHQIGLPRPPPRTVRVKPPVGGPLAGTRLVIATCAVCPTSPPESNNITRTKGKCLRDESPGALLRPTCRARSGLLAGRAAPSHDQTVAAGALH